MTTLGSIHITVEVETLHVDSTELRLRTAETVRVADLCDAIIAGGQA